MLDDALFRRKLYPTGKFMRIEITLDSELDVSGRGGHFLSERLSAPTAGAAESVETVGGGRVTESYLRHPSPSGWVPRFVRLC